LRYFIELSYKGTFFHGWQYQPNAISVQEKFEDALSKLLKTPHKITAAGRTDTGVHAKTMIAHFDTAVSFEPEKLTYRLNAFLSENISVQKIYEVHPEAHARFDAISRSYEYYIHTRKDPFLDSGSYLVKEKLDVSAMNVAAKLLLEYTNFKCFSRSKTQVHTYNCTITHAEWKQHKHQLIFYITANRFLRNMVRAIVGTLLEIGKGKKSIEDLKNIIASQNRSEAGASLPAKGLYLTDVVYPKSTYLSYESKN